MTACIPNTNMRKKLTTILLSAALAASLLTTPLCNVTITAAATGTIADSAIDGDPEADKHLNSENGDTETASSGINILSHSLKGSSQSANPYTGLTYTHADAFDGKNIYNGIDVSKYQPTVDWEKVKADGIDFVFIRVGYRGYGAAGTLAADVCFEKHVEGALAAGLRVGLYYYTEAINTTEAKEEAEYCIEKAKNYDITLPIVYDYETTTVGGVKTGRKYNAKLSKSAATKNCIAFCDTIKEAGYTPMVYANKSDLSTLINGTTLAKSYKIWLANYTTATTYTGTYEYWQYSSSGKIDGISGKVDCNYWYTDDTIAEENPNAIDIKDGKFASVPTKTYTGSGITPTPKLTLNGKTLVKDTDYQLSYQNNTAVGTATITATGMKDYKGTLSVTFKIIPKKVTSFKKKSGTKTVTLSWAKNEQATGYQIYRKATYNGKTYTKVKTYKQNSKITWTNTPLKSDREYFYCIRAYTKVDGKNYYSGYTYLSAATLPGSKKAVISEKTNLYEAPDLTGDAIAVIPKFAQITYIGRTYVTSTQIVYHVKYSDSTTTYNGYIPSTVKITF